MSKYVSSPIALQLYFNSGENGVIAPTVVDGITRRKVDLPQFHCSAGGGIGALGVDQQLVEVGGVVVMRCRIQEPPPVFR